MENRTEIALSKKKLIFALACSLAFVLAGIFFIVKPAVFNRQTGLLSFFAAQIIGIVSIVFFGFAAIYLAPKLPENKPGLIIDETGIIDNASGVAAGRILWGDITHLSVLSMHKQSFILIHVINPQEYIDKQKSLFKRKMMQMNFKLYGSPITISANSLKVKFEELYELLSEAFGRNASSNSELIT